MTRFQTAQLADSIMLIENCGGKSVGLLRNAVL
jgi:hypothetical protein